MVKTIRTKLNGSPLIILFVFILTQMGTSIWWASTINAKVNNQQVVIQKLEIEKENTPVDIAIMQTQYKQIITDIASIKADMKEEFKLVRKEIKDLK